MLYFSVYSRLDIMQAIKQYTVMLYLLIYHHHQQQRSHKVLTIWVGYMVLLSSLRSVKIICLIKLGVFKSLFIVCIKKNLGLNYFINCFCCCCCWVFKAVSWDMLQSAYKVQKRCTEISRWLSVEHEFVYHLQVPETEKQIMVMFKKKRVLHWNLRFCIKVLI